MRSQLSRPVSIELLLNTHPSTDISLHFVDRPLPEVVTRWEVGVLQLSLPSTDDMVECFAVLLVSIKLRVVRPDPTREARTDRLRVFLNGLPIDKVLALGIDKRHLLCAGNTLVSVTGNCQRWYVLLWKIKPKSPQLVMHFHSSCYIAKSTYLQTCRQ